VRNLLIEIRGFGDVVRCNYSNTSPRLGCKSISPEFLEHSSVEFLPKPVDGKITIFMEAGKVSLEVAPPKHGRK